MTRIFNRHTGTVQYLNTAQFMRWLALRRMAPKDYLGKDFSTRHEWVSDVGHTHAKR